MICNWNTSCLREKVIEPTNLYEKQMKPLNKQYKPMFSKKTVIKPVKQQIKPKKSIHSNYGGFEIIQHTFFVLLGMFYTVWTMRFGVIEHTPNAIICFLEWVTTKTNNFSGRMLKHTKAHRPNLIEPCWKPHKPLSWMMSKPT